MERKGREVVVGDEEEVAFATWSEADAEGMSDVSHGIPVPVVVVAAAVVVELIATGSGAYVPAMGDSGKGSPRSGYTVPLMEHAAEDGASQGA